MRPLHCWGIGSKAPLSIHAPPPQLSCLSSPLQRACLCRWSCSHGMNKPRSSPALPPRTLVSRTTHLCLQVVVLPQRERVRLVQRRNTVNVLAGHIELSAEG